MSTALSPTGHQGHPAVTGKPLWWLCAEAAIELLAAVCCSRRRTNPGGSAHSSWYPMSSCSGTPEATKLGAGCHNLAHTQIVPILLALAALEWHRPLVLAVRLVRLAHIGLDRALAYGLKCDSDFQHTHLGEPASVVGATLVSGPAPLG